MQRQQALILIFLFSSCLVFSRNNPQDKTETAPQDVIVNLYDLVSFGPDNPPRWEEVRSLFIEDAIIVLRTSRDSCTRFTVDGFINDFKKFAAEERIQINGFSEKIIRVKKTVFGDIAHFLVLYEASIPGTDFKPQQGVDSFQLIKSDSTWRILSITNEIPGPDNPLPDELIE
jgi:hypothetical protein